MCCGCMGQNYYSTYCSRGNKPVAKRSGCLFKRRGSHIHVLTALIEGVDTASHIWPDFPTIVQYM